MTYALSMVAVVLIALALRTGSPKQPEKKLDVTVRNLFFRRAGEQGRQHPTVHAPDGKKVRSHFSYATRPGIRSRNLQTIRRMSGQMQEPTTGTFPTVVPPILHM